MDRSQDESDMAGGQGSRCADYWVGPCMEFVGYVVQIHDVSHQGH